jgi:hypothetical protein
MMPANVAETLVQEVGLYHEVTVLSDFPDAPLYEGKYGRTGDLEHVVSHAAGNVGSPKQGRPCMVTELS